MTANRPSTGSVSLLRERFDRLREAGLKDLKFWFVGGASEETNLESLSDEVMSMLDAHEAGRYVDVSEKLK